MQFVFFGIIALLLMNGQSVGRFLAKRALPINKNCDPRSQVCRKGDWISQDVAACEYHSHNSMCSINSNHLNWMVNLDKDDACIPTNGLQFLCGAINTHTRCVCSDENFFYNFLLFKKIVKNQCKCQYWPEEDIGAKSPAFCTGYYAGGDTTVHHWICCNNCNDREANTCDGKTWQGGSSVDYCAACGENTGNGYDKYYFNCGSCEEQYRCETECNKSSPFIKLPGFCWLWTDCFKNCCLHLPQYIASR